MDDWGIKLARIASRRCGMVLEKTYTVVAIVAIINELRSYLQLVIVVT